MLRFSWNGLRVNKVYMSSLLSRVDWGCDENTWGIVLIFNLKKNIDVTIKKNEKVNYKSREIDHQRLSW